MAFLDMNSSGKWKKEHFLWKWEVHPRIFCLKDEYKVTEDGLVGGQTGDSMQKLTMRQTEHETTLKNT